MAQLEVIALDTATPQLRAPGGSDTYLMPKDLTIQGTATVDVGATINGGAVFNETGADVDFRIESDTNANAFELDGTTGNIGIGGAPVDAAARVTVRGAAPSSGGASRQFYADATIPSTTTTAANNFQSTGRTEATSFTLTSFSHYLAQQATLGAGSAITNQFGFNAVSTLTGATNNYGFYSNIASGSGRYNFFANGSADNYFAGRVGVGTTTPNYQLEIYGANTSFRMTDSNPTNSTYVSGSTGANSAQVGVARQGGNPSSAFLNAVGNSSYLSLNGLSGTANLIRTESNGDLTIEVGGSTRIYINDTTGNVGIGGAPSTSTKLNILGTLATSGTVSFGVGVTGTIPSGSTSGGYGFSTGLNTEAASFTLGELRHYSASQGTIGAGSTVTNQFGFIAGSNLTGATNNFGFYSDIASAANRWNFYAAGTATNYFEGDVGIGTTSPLAKLSVYGSPSGTLNDQFRVTSSTAAAKMTLVGTGAGNNAGFEVSSGDLIFYNATANTERMRITSDGNAKIGGTADRATTEGTNQLVLFDGTAPVGTLANGVSFYSASGEANVMDAAGNATLLSPHDSETNEWIFRSKHTPTGKVLKIDVEKMLRFINEHFDLDMVQEWTE